MTFSAKRHFAFVHKANSGEVYARFRALLEKVISINRKTGRKGDIIPIDPDKPDVTTFTHSKG